MSTIRETVSSSSPTSGANRVWGMVISFVTAIAVFAVGQAIVSHFRGSTTVAEDVAPPPPPKPAFAPPPPAPVAAAPAAAPTAPSEPAAAAAPAEQASAKEPAVGAAAPVKEPVAAAPTEGTAAPAAAVKTTEPVNAPSPALTKLAVEAPAAKAEAPKAAAPSEAAPAVAVAMAPKKVSKAVVGPKPEAATPAEAPAPATTESPTSAKPTVAAKAKASGASASPTKTATSGASAPSAAAAPASAPAAHAVVAEKAPPAEAPGPAKDNKEPTAAAAAGATAATTGDGKPTDKDIAREAWRRNLPDISSPDDTKASILIPIKGSIEGATYHVNTKPKSVVINLPKADPLITMRFYKLKREGMRNLWILKQEEGEGTTVKLMLGEAVSPSVEIKDDFVRINVRKPPDMKPEE